MPTLDSARLSRRGFIARSAALATLGAASGSASAADWPGRPVKLVVVFPAGGSVDNTTRIFADKLRELLGVPVLVENRPGGSTVVGARSVLAAPRDGHTFLVTIPLTMYLPALIDKVPFEPEADLIPVGPFSFEQLVLAASTRSGIRSFDEMRERVRAAPERHPFGSYGVGTDAHLLAVQLGKQWGAELLHVPYAGGMASVQAIASGDTTFTLGPAATCKQFIDSGVLRPLAVRGHPRSPFFPNVPTLTELGVPGYEHPIWCGLFAARGTPMPAIEGMSQALRACARYEHLQARLRQGFSVAHDMARQQFAQLARDAALNDANMFRAAGIRMDG